MEVLFLFGLILSVGLLVDGAVVVVEYAQRKIQEGMGLAESYIKAASRMSLPIMASTFTTIAAFIPLLFWPGTTGGFMKYIPITVISVLGSSLAMALIVIPIIGTQAYKIKNLFFFFIIPLILVSITFVWGIRSYLKMVIVPDDAIEIKVTGQSWFWTFDYPDGGTTLNELVVPSNKPVKLVLSSKDVLHSFFIPVMRSKMDCLPNRYNVMWFDATKEGVYDIFCTEYCGTGHSQMGAKVIVMQPAQYEEWASELGSEDDDLPLDELGAKLYTKKACNTCHTLDGSALVGPSYLQTSQMWGQERVFDDGTSTVIDDNYIRSSILEPMTQIVAGYQGVMPTYQGLLSDRELDALIAFLKTLNEDSQI